MSCPEERVHHGYVDGELAPAEVREVELHLIGCERCRVRVLALREEAALLGDVLSGRVEPAAVPLPSEERALAMGFPAALAAVTAAVVVAGALLELAAPRGLGWLNPLRLSGVGEMVFDVFFMVRDQAPGLVEFAAAIAATASVAALASVAVSALFRRVGGLPLLLVGGLLFAGDARAVVVEFHEGFELAAGETLGESVLASGETVRVAGTLEGDLVAAGAERIVVSGVVRGNVFAWGRDVEISGTVTGGIYAAGQRVRVDGEVGGTALIAGEAIDLGPEARARGDVVAFCEAMVADGTLGRDLVFVGDSLEVRGSVGRDVDVRTARLVDLIGSARVAGDVHAVVPEEDAVEVASGAVIGGSVTTAPSGPGHRGRFSHFLEGHYYVWLLARLVAAFLFGLALYALLPGLFDNRLPTPQAFFASLGLGFLFLIAAPLVLVVVALTVVGLPLALLGVAVYAAALYLAAVLVGSLLGRRLMAGASRVTLAGFAQTLIVGLAVALAAMQLPIVGFPVRLVVVLLGLGLLVERLRAAFSGPASARVALRG